MEFEIFLISMIIMSIACFVALFIQRKVDIKWYDMNCECTCGKCGCHRPLEECS